MSERGSLAWSIAAPILAAVLAALILGGLALGWSLQRTIETSVRGEIALDIAAIRQGEERLRVIAVADAIDHRIAAAPATSGGLYILVDRNGEVITGNLARIPTGAAQDNWIRFSAAAPEGRMVSWLGRKQTLPQGYTLFVARRADGLWLMLRQAAPAIGLILFGALTLIGLVLSRTSRRIAGTISDFNAVIDAARTGAPDRRLNTTGQPKELELLGLHTNALLDTIERQLANMRRFSTQAAHELSTPLARAVARLRHGSSLSDVDQSREEIEETLSLLNALLDIAEHESELGVAAQAHDLAAICASVCDMYCDAAIDRDITLERSLMPALVLGEGPLLTRAVANLLDNALKAGPPGSTVNVTTGVEANSAFLRVIDEGPGVDGRTIDGLLSSPGARPRAPGSHGLGLRFTRAIAMRHSAVLTAGQGDAKGSVFTITFPKLVP